MKHTHSGGMRPFLILWGGQSLSTMGSAMTSYALLLWVYAQQGTATSMALLSFFSSLPSILFCFVAGSLADRFDKKRIMLLCDTVAALGTVYLFVLHGTGALRIGHLYAVNLLISFMGAFQNPAAYVAVSVLAPRDQYVRVSGLHSLSNALTSIITPAFATVLMAWGGLRAIFLVDLLTFSIASVSLLCFIHLPTIEETKAADKHSLWKDCVEGIRFLLARKPLLSMISFFAYINLIAYTCGMGAVLPAMVLKRSGNDEMLLGLVRGATGIGALIGSIAVAAMKPAKSRTRAIFLCCGFSFLLSDVLWGIGQVPWIWVVGGFFAHLLLPALNANLTTIMRTQVPLPLQGRVFAARDTMQYATIPIGLLMGGWLSDLVFEPFMAGTSNAASLLSNLVGRGPGAGTALMFIISGVLGSFSSFLCLRSRRLRVLDDVSEGEVHA